MDFWALPPELISARMYSGPGSGSFRTAAAAWDALAAELSNAAAGYGAVIAGLVDGPWAGPSAAAMAAAAAPYVAWLSGSATRAGQTATQAIAAATAYETAFAATVPPAAIAANRSQLAGLVATNVFGQNLAAIATLETQYAQMWAQDLAAMSGYTASAAAATPPPGFTGPSRTTSDTPPAASGGGVPSMLSRASTLPGSLAAGDPAPPSEIGQIYQDLFGVMSLTGRFATIANDSMSAPNVGMVQFKTFYQPPAPPEIPKSALGAGLGLQQTVSTARTASAGLGEALTVGRLSVPPTWATATPAVRLAAAALPAAGADAAPALGLPGSLLAPAALGSMSGGATRGSAPRAVGRTRIVGGAGTNGKGPVKLDRILAQLQRKPDTVQHWQVDKAGLDDLLAELAKKPGNHAVHVSASGKSTAGQAK